MICQLVRGRPCSTQNSQREGRLTALDSHSQIVQQVVEQSPRAIRFLVEAHNFLCKWVSWWRKITVGWIIQDNAISRLEWLEKSSVSHSPFNPSVCNWKSFPNSNGRTRNWLLFKSSSLWTTKGELNHQPSWERALFPFENNLPFRCLQKKVWLN